MLTTVTSEEFVEAKSATPNPVTTCPVERAIRVIGGKWKLLVLRSLLLNGPQRYNELLTSVSGISAKELTRNLRELSAEKLVELSGEAVPHYELTSQGQGLMPTFAALLTWGQTVLMDGDA